MSKKDNQIPGIYDALEATTALQTRDGKPSITAQIFFAARLIHPTNAAHTMWRPEPGSPVSISARGGVKVILRNEDGVCDATLPVVFALRAAAADPNLFKTVVASIKDPSSFAAMVQNAREGTGVLFQGQLIAEAYYAQRKVSFDYPKIESVRRVIDAERAAEEEDGDAEDTDYDEYKVMRDQIRDFKGLRRVMSRTTPALLVTVARAYSESLEDVITPSSVGILRARSFATADGGQVSLADIQRELESGDDDEGVFVDQDAFLEEMSNSELATFCYVLRFCRAKMADKSVRVRDYYSAVTEWLVEAETPLKTKAEEEATDSPAEGQIFADDDESASDVDPEVVQDTDDVQEDENND